MYKKLISFDFDGTLIDTPTPDVGIPIWEKEIGSKWPGKGWWANSESLNTNVFKPELIEHIYDHFINYSINSDHYVFIATGRIKRLEKHVKNVLGIYNIDNDLYCNTGGDTFSFKTNLFETLIQKNPKADELIMFDDRDEHLEQFKIWAKKQKVKITIYDSKTNEIIF